MKHLKKDRCGYYQYTCKGIGLMPEIQLGSDSHLYELDNSSSTEAYITDVNLWPDNYNNINNVPRFLAGPARILSLRYPFLGSCSYNVVCYNSMSMFDLDAVHLFYMYSDSFAAVQQTGGSAYPGWALHLISYHSSDWFASDSSQDAKYVCHPAIVTPLFLTGLFSPIAAITVPVTIVGTTGGGGRDINPLALAKALATGTALGGCVSCKLEASFRTVDRLGATPTILKVRVEDSRAILVYTNIGRKVVADGKTKYICKGRVGSDSFSISRYWADSDTISFAQSLFDYSDTRIILISARVTYALDQWLGLFVRYISSNLRPDVMQQHDYLIPVANIVISRNTPLRNLRYRYYTLKVVQLQCLPIEIRDWAAEATTPTGTGPDDTSSMYVFYRMANSDITGWYPLTLCSS